MKGSYLRFALMIATSTVVMFGLMYLNTYAWDHVYWSQTRAWMALLMGAVMAIVMMGFMWRMYPRRAVNAGVLVGAVAVAALSLWLVRSQATVDDVSYMKAMIPHHSIAIMTSTRAQITDPRVRRLADEIASAQRKEIAEMRYLVESIEQSGEQQAREATRTPPRLVPPAEAVHGAVVATTDLSSMDAAEVARVLGNAPRCGFRYSVETGPVVAVTRRDGAVAGVAKLHGRLVALHGAMQPGNELLLSADGMRIRLEQAGFDEGAAGTLRTARARLHLDAGLDAGYLGYYGCDAPST